MKQAEFRMNFLFAIPRFIPLCFRMFSDVASRTRKLFTFVWGIGSPIGKEAFWSPGLSRFKRCIDSPLEKSQKTVIRTLCLPGEKNKKKKQVWHNQIAANWKLLCKLTEKQPAFHVRQYNKSYRGAIFWYKWALGQLPWFRSIFISPAFFKIEMETRPFFKSNHSENGYFFGV